MPKKITIGSPEDGIYNPATSEFIYVKPQTIVIEHSLVSLSKWESFWKIPFLSSETKTSKQIIDYIKCMTITQNVDPSLYLFLDNKTIEEIVDYIHDPMTATTFHDRSTNGASKRYSHEIVTSELIYYWMLSYGIPMECQKWHLERLMTLIRVFDIKNSPKKNMKKSDIYRNNAAINAANRKRFHTRG